MYPGPGPILRVEVEVDAEHEPVPAGTRETSVAGAGGPTGGAGEPTIPHVREWQVRVSIFEAGDDTSANVTRTPVRAELDGGVPIRLGPAGVSPSRVDKERS
jgi:hypothetical protein